MAAGTEKERQKTIEFSCIEAVALASGCTAVGEDEAIRWPDGWLLHGEGKREPVEVVAAFKRPAGEDPKKGSAWLRHWKQPSTASLPMHPLASP